MIRNLVFVAAVLVLTAGPSHAMIAPYHAVESGGAIDAGIGVDPGEEPADIFLSDGIPGDPGRIETDEERGEQYDTGQDGFGSAQPGAFGSLALLGSSIEMGRESRSMFLTGIALLAVSLMGDRRY